MRGWLPGFPSPRALEPLLALMRGEAGPSRVLTAYAPAAAPARPMVGFLPGFGGRLTTDQMPVGLGGSGVNEKSSTKWDDAPGVSVWDTLNDLFCTRSESA